MNITLHGFTYDTPEARQKSAETHHLWPGFVAWMVSRGYGPGNYYAPDMDELDERLLFEAFSEGAYQQFRVETEDALPPATQFPLESSCNP